MTKFKVAAIQMRCSLGEPERNLRKAEYFIRRAADAGAATVCLPELFDSGYDLRWVKRNVQSQFPESSAVVSSLSAELGIYIVAGMANVRRGRFYNSAHIFSPEGRIVGRYDKIHPFPLTHEERYFEKGVRAHAAETQFGRVGMGLCFDLRFCNLFYQQANQGAQIIFVPSAWGLARLHHWLLLLRARAVENQLYMVAANQVGAPGTIAFAGHSAIIGFDGAILVEKKAGEGVIVAEVDLDALRKKRKELPMR